MDLELVCFELELEYLELDPLIEPVPTLELAPLVELAPMQELSGQMDFIKIFIFQWLPSLYSSPYIFICNLLFCGTNGINSIGGVGSNCESDHTHN